MVQKRDKILGVILLILIIFISETYIINAFSYGIRINPGIKVGNLTNSPDSNNPNIDEDSSSDFNDSENNDDSQIFQNDSETNDNEEITDSADESDLYSENSDTETSENTENSNTLFLNKNSAEKIDSQDNKKSDSSQKTSENQINKKDAIGSIFKSNNINENLIFVLGEMAFLFTMILISLTSYSYIAKGIENQAFLRKV